MAKFSSAPNPATRIAQAQAIASRLAQSVTANTSLQCDLSISHIMLAEVLATDGSIGEARASLDPSKASCKSDLDWVRDRIATRRQGANR